MRLVQRVRPVDRDRLDQPGVVRKQRPQAPRGRRQEMHGDAVRPQDAVQLGLECVHVGDVLEHVGGEDDVESGVGGRDAMPVVVFDGEYTLRAELAAGKIERPDLVAGLGQQLCLPAAAAADLDKARSGRLARRYFRQCEIELGLA